MSYLLVVGEIVKQQLEKQNAVVDFKQTDFNELRVTRMRFDDELGRDVADGYDLKKGIDTLTFFWKPTMQEIDAVNSFLESFCNVIGCEVSDKQVLSSSIRPIKERTEKQLANLSACINNYQRFGSRLTLEHLFMKDLFSETPDKTASSLERELKTQIKSEHEWKNRNNPHNEIYQKRKEEYLSSEMDENDPDYEWFK